MLLTCPEGNYGSIAGDPNAAMRYIETNMTQFAYDCFFKDWNDILVDFKDNYAKDLLEPEFLPARYPYILFNGTTGLAYGLYCGIPPFNVGDIIDLTKSLIKNPNKKHIYAIPDFPTGCDIVDTDFEKMCDTGEGSINMRAHIELNERGNLVITSIPFQTTVSDIIDKILELKNVKNKLEGIEDIKDHSKNNQKEVYGVLIDYMDMNIELVLKKGADPEQIKDILYKSTPLAGTFAFRFEMVDDYENVHYNMKGYLLDWIEFRRNTKRRNYLYKYSVKNKRHHMLSVIIEIISKKDSDKKLMSIMRGSKNKQEVIDKLIKEFKITDVQAYTIAQFQYVQLNKEAIKNFKEEKKKIKEEMDELYNIIHDDDYLDKEIIEELNECKEKYNTPRRCNIIKIKDKDYVEDTNHIVIFTKKGMIKKIPDNIDEVGMLEQGDKVVSHIKVNNRDSLLVFDSIGKCYNLSVNDIISSSLDSLGYDITNYIKTENKIVSVIKLPEEDEYNKSIIFVTKNGIIKRSELGNYVNATKSGISGITLKKSKTDKDKLVDVIITKKKSADLMIYTENGKCIRFGLKEVPITLRVSSGVIGIKLDDDDKVIGIDLLDKNKKYLAIITTKGNGKKVLIDKCEKTNRALTGYTLINVDEKEKIVGMKAINENDSIDIIFNNRIETILESDLKKSTKIAKGNKIVKCKNGEQIIAVC